MNVKTATLVILFGVFVALVPMKAPSLTFEERWEPVKELQKAQELYVRPLTFEERWEPVRRLPPMLPARPEPAAELEPRIIPVRTISIRQDLTEMAPTVQTAAQTVEVPLPQARPAIKPRPNRVADICQRHGMRKVDYGRRWRCRR